MVAIDGLLLRKMNDVIIGLRTTSFLATNHPLPLFKRFYWVLAPACRNGSPRKIMTKLMIIMRVCIIYSAFPSMKFLEAMTVLTLFTRTGY